MAATTAQLRQAIREADVALTRFDEAKKEADAKLGTLAALLADLQQQQPAEPPASEGTA